MGRLLQQQHAVDRAMALHAKGALLGALQQLHVAKSKWFAEETLRGSVLAILLLSKWYTELGFALAGKYYALAGAFLAGTSSDLSLRRYVPPGIFMAADCDYILGAWCSYILLSRVGLAASLEYETEVDPTSVDSAINRTLYHAGVAYSYARSFAPDLRTAIRQSIEGWNVAEDLDEVLGVFEPRGDDESVKDQLERLRNERIELPFTDAGEERCVKFRALGVLWILKWENTPLASGVGEHFTAALQILLADVGELDVCFLPTTVNVAVQVGDAPPTGALEEEGDTGSSTVTLPDPRTNADFDLSVFVATTGLLVRASALPMKKVEKLVKERIASDLVGKLRCGQPLASLERQLVTDADFAGLARKTRPEIPDNWEPYAEHRQLRGAAGPGPNYSSVKHEAGVHRRYEELTKRLSEAMPYLSTNPTLRAAAAMLRESGWKDWHILLAVYNAILNYSSGVPGVKPGGRQGVTHEERLRSKARLPVLHCTTAIPHDVLCEENLRRCLSISMMATLKGWGLVLNWQHVDLLAVERLLSERYAYWTTDTEHEALGF